MYLSTILNYPDGVVDVIAIVLLLLVAAAGWWIK